MGGNDVRFQTCVPSKPVCLHNPRRDASPGPLPVPKQLPGSVGEVQVSSQQGPFDLCHRACAEGAFTLLHAHAVWAYFASCPTMPSALLLFGCGMLRAPVAWVRRFLLLHSARSSGLQILRSVSFPSVAAHSCSICLLLAKGADFPCLVPTTGHDRASWDALPLAAVCQLTALRICIRRSILPVALQDSCINPPGPVSRTRQIDRFPLGILYDVRPSPKRGSAHRWLSHSHHPEGWCPAWTTSCSLKTQSRQGTVPSGTGTIIGAVLVSVKKSHPCSFHKEFTQISTLGA